MKILLYLDFYVQIIYIFIPNLDRSVNLSLPVPFGTGASSSCYFPLWGAVNPPPAGGLGQLL